MGRKLLGNPGITLLNPSVLGASIVMTGTAHGFEEQVGFQAEQRHHAFPLTVGCWEHSMCDAVQTI